MRCWLVLLLLAVVGTPVLLYAQVAFEVATIKENTSADNNSILRRPPGGRVDATNVPLRFLITYAYALPQQAEIVGGPAWITSVGYDIVAKLEGNPQVVPPGSGIDPARLAMRALLADRFKLTMHREAKQVDIYALVLVKPQALVRLAVDAGLVRLRRKRSAATMASHRRVRRSAGLMADPVESSLEACRRPRSLRR
jgi:uncharacterized protein (TIGR03435 family)